MEGSFKQPRMRRGREVVVCLSLRVSRVSDWPWRICPFRGGTRRHHDISTRAPRRTSTSMHRTKGLIADVSRRYRCIFCIFVNCIAAWSAKKRNTRTVQHMY